MAKLPEQTMSPSYNDRGALHSHIAGDHGVIMLSHCRQILYINPVAKRLVQELQETESSVACSSQTLPRQLVGLCQTLQGQLAQHSDREEWKHVQVQQAITTSKHRLLLRASGLPAESASSGHRMLIFLEVPASDRMPSPAPPKSLHLSTRQQAIVDGLIRGLSNKLIADELHVSEYTVKEYLRTIMLKMQVGTRGAVIARFLGSPSMAPARIRKRASRAPLAVRVAT